MTLGERFADWKSAVRSYGLAMSASRRLGRCSKLRRVGRIPEALQVAREGLALLNAPVARRRQGPEGSLILSLTMQVEELANELGEPGVDITDLADSAEFLRSLSPTKEEALTKLRRDWLPYLEDRLLRISSDGPSHA